MKGLIASLLVSAATVASASGFAGSSPSSPSDMTSALERRIVSGEGVMYPGEDAASRTTPRPAPLDTSWPDAFLDRIGETVEVRVSPATGCYEFSDEAGTVFWIEVPVAPLTWNWVAPFLRPFAQPDIDHSVLAPWHFADRWILSTEAIGDLRGAASRRAPRRPAPEPAAITGLCFTAFAFTRTNLYFTAAWPTNDTLPDNTVDLYCSTNELTRFPFLLSSFPATNPPVAFTLNPTFVPNWNVATAHVHDATCPVVTNVVLSPLDGVTVYTNIAYGCAVDDPPGEAAFFRLGTRVDADGDGLSDAFERNVTLTSANAADTDWDGLDDGAEWLLGADPLARDSDGDGLVDGIDPAPATWTDPADVNTNGIPDAFELHWFGALDPSLDPTARDATGFTLAAEMAAGLRPTSTPFSAIVPTNGVESVQLVPRFGIESAANAILWEKTIPIARHGAWEQYFVSADPNPARDRSEGVGGWTLDGLRLDWADSTGASGSATASPVCAPLHLPVSTNGPAWIRLRLVATRETLATCPQPLHFLIYVPEFSLPDLPSAEQGTTRLSASVTGEDVDFEIDRSTRPTWQAFLPGEADALPFELPDTAALDWRPQSENGLSTGTLAFERSGVFSIPQIVSVETVPLRGGLRAPPVSREFLLAILDPVLTYGVPHAWGGSRGIAWDWESQASVRTSSYPLDSEWLWRSFRCDDTGGFVCNCEPELSLGGEEVEAYRAWFDVDIEVAGDTAEATVELDGDPVWNGTATHEWYDWGAPEEPLADTCGCGGADDLEGATHASLGFRIPLGLPRAGQVSGFLWFHADGPLVIAPDAFQLLTRDDAAVSDATAGGVRTVVCSDARGRTLALSTVANGVRIAVTDTATGSLEHTWDLVNENGSASRVRLTNVSRLGNTLSDAVFVHDGTDWHRIDPIANTLETLRTENLLDDPWEPRFVEERVLADAADTNRVYSHTLSVSHRFGDLLRETGRCEDAGTPFEKWSYATYWEDGGRRAGLPRLVSGDARAWSWSDYDALGRPTLRFDQLDGSPCPTDATDHSLQSPPWDCAATATVSDYTPLAGDSNHTNDLDAVRTQSRYRIERGAATLVARTWNVYARTMTNGWPVVSVRTERAASQTASFGDPTNAVSVSVSIDPDAHGVPLLLRGRPLSCTDEDGVTTSYDYAFGSWDPATRTFAPASGASHLRTRVFVTTPEAPAGVPLVSTVSETVEDATHGNEVWTATRVRLADGSLSDPFDWEARVYDDKDRLRATRYADGSSATNAYSCCRLLFTVDRNGMKRERLADTGTDHLRHAWLDVSFAALPKNQSNGYLVPQTYDYSKPEDFRAVASTFDPLGRETVHRTMATRPRLAEGIGSLRPAPGSAAASYWWDTSETNSYPFGSSDCRVRIDARGLRTVTTVFHDPEAVETRTEEFDGTNLLARTVSRSVRGGASETVRAWDGGCTTNRTFSLYGADGRRIDFSVAEASDAPAVTNSISASDFLGRTVRVVTPLSDSTYAYAGASSRVLSVSDAVSGVSSATIYDALREPVGSLGSDGVASFSSTRYECDASNVWWRVSEEREAAGGATNLLSTVRERLTGLSDALRSETVSVPAGGPVSTTTVSFDPATCVSVETNLVDGLAPFVRKSKFGRTTETQERDGTLRNYYFDPYGRSYLVGETPPGGSFVWRTWTWRNAIGDPVAEMQITGRSPAASGLAPDHASSLSDPGSALWTGFETDRAYDVRGNVVASWDEEGNGTGYERDSIGRLVYTYGATYPSARALDTAGHLVALGTTRTGEVWDVTQLGWDPATGLCTNKTYADGTIVSHAFTPDGLPSRTTLASGRWTQSAYDAARRLSATTDSDGNSVQYAYDAFGRLASATDGTGRSETFARDTLGRITNETQSVSGLSASLDRSFDAFGRSAGYRLEIGGDFAQSVCYTYGTDGRMDTITVTNAQGRSVSVGYDWEQGRLAGCTVSDAAGSPLFSRTQTRALRRPALVTTVTNAGFEPLTSNLSPLTFSYAYDAVGRPVTRNEDAFSYNIRGEVVSAAIGTNAATYAYDHIGNRTASSDLQGARTYTANELNQYTNLTSHLPPLTSHLSYDADGNLVAFGNRTNAWSAPGRLASTMWTEAGHLARLRNEYDHRGRRVRRTLETSSDDGATWTAIETRTFIYDDWDLLYERSERPGESAAELVYFWGPDLSGALQGAGGVGGLVAVSIDGDFYFPGYDNNGNVIGYWNESGSLVAEYAYDAFGSTISSSGSMSSVFPHRFSTKYYDSETDLYYYGYRYYSPSLGRWISRDPIAEAGEINLFGFLGNAPLSSVDLLGMIFINFVTIDESGETTRVNGPEDIKILKIPSYHSFGTFDPQSIRAYYYCNWQRNLAGVDVILSIRIRQSVRPEIDYPSGTYIGYDPHVMNGMVRGVWGNRNQPWEAVEEHERGHAKGYWLAAKPELERVFGAIPISGWHRLQSSRDAEAKKLQTIHDNIAKRTDIDKVIKEEADKATLRYFSEKSDLYQAESRQIAQAAVDLTGLPQLRQRFDYVWRKK